MGELIRMKKTCRLLGGACLAVLSIAAGAQQRTNPVESRLDARKVTVSADGKETLAAAESARPGDLIEYTATYRNSGTGAVRNLEATLPIPADTELVAGSVKPAASRASLDARSFAPVPLKRKAVAAGREVESEVPLREYRALRWAPADLAAGQIATYSARVRVVVERAPNTPAGKASPQ